MHRRHNPVRRARSRGRQEGSALLEFAIALPLLVVFIVGIYDFSGAFNTKLKIQHAAQLGAVLAAAQPTSDLDPANSTPGPGSLLPVAAVVFNSLNDDGVLPLASPTGTCKPPAVSVSNAPPLLQWTYVVSGCPDTLTIVINRSATAGSGPVAVGTTVQVQYPYHWRFNSAIQLLFPGASYAAITTLTEEATVHNQN